MNREQKIAIWVFGIGILLAGVFAVALTWEDKEEHPEFITTTYESPITGDCFEIVRRYNRSDSIISIEIDCELINE